MITVTREPVRILLFSASMRAASLNTRLVRLAPQTIEVNGGVVEPAEMRDFDSPSYSQDVQERDGFPAGAEALRRRLEANDAFRYSVAGIQLLHAGPAQTRNRLGIEIQASTVQRTARLANVGLAVHGSSLAAYRKE